MSLNGRSMSGAPYVRAGGIATVTGDYNVRVPLSLVNEPNGRGAALAAMPEPSPAEREGAPLERIAVRSRNRILFLDTSEVAWLEAYGNYVRFHLREAVTGGVSADSVHTVRGTLTSFEARLDPSRFVRIHRSVIVNVDVVRELHSRRTGDFTIITRNGERLTLSRNFRNRVPELRKLLAS
jgi:two-component system, LytTR family, response regulator